MVKRKRLYVCLDVPEGVASVIMAKSRGHARALVVKRLAQLGQRPPRTLRVQELYP